MQKDSKENTNLSDKDKEELFDIIKEAS